MKYRILLIPILLGFLASCEKEISEKQEETFMKYYGNYLLDEASDLAVLNNGGFAICGTDSTEDGKRMVLIITDSYGNVQSGFPRHYTMQDSVTGTNLESGANAVEAIKGGDGGYMLFGYVENPNSDNTGFQKDAFVVKVSIDGTGRGVSYGSNEDEVILHATKRIVSGYMLAGYQVADGKSDLMFFGIKEQLDSIPLGLLYNNPYAENSAANYVLNHGDHYLCVCTYDKINEPGTDILVLNITETLEAAPEYLSGDFSEFGMCVIEEGPNSFLVLGNRSGVSGRMAMVLYLIETSGDRITKSTQLATITQPNTDLIGRRIAKTLDGRYVIVGSRSVYGAPNDIFLQFLSADFAVTGNVVFGSSGAQEGADIAIADDGGILVLGTNVSDANSMMSLIKTSDTGDF